MEWIDPVKKEYPDFERLLICTKGDYVVIAFFDRGSLRWIGDNGKYVIKLDELKAWSYINPPK